MNLPRTSIKTLMAFVVLFGVGFAALTRPSQGWAILLSAFAFTALLTSLLGVIFRRGPARAGWVGFAVFGWSFFALLFSYYDPKISPFEFGFDFRSNLDGLQQALYAVASLDGKKVAELLQAHGKVDLLTERWVALSLIGLAFALLGGGIARFLARQEAQGGSREKM